ncbi:unnamed protein product, partial [Heterotrigona itama]
MLRNLTLEKAINIIRLSVALTFCWPLRSSNSKTVIFGYRVMQICAAINMSLLLLPTLYTVYLRSDVEIVFHSITQAIFEVQSIVQTIICFSKYDTLQYPFDVNNQTLVSAIIHAHQIITCHQVCAHECMCLFGALLIWFTAARFECLMAELQNTADIRMLAPYIEKHLQKAINIIRLSVALTFCWPLRPNNSKTVIFGYRVMQICAAINISLLLLPTLYTTYLQSDVEIVSHCVTQAIGEIQSIVQTIICFSKYDTLQHIIEELWSFIEGAQRYEKDILHEYFARVNVLYGCYIVAMYIIGFVGLIGPLFLPIVDIIFVEYPFDVNNRTLVSAIIQVQQIIACHQVCAHECMCLFGALLIWFTAARFECLIVELQSTADIRMLAWYIEKHLRLKRYAEEVAECFRFMVLFVVAACMLVITISALAIVTSLKCSQSVYDLPWYEQTARMQKNMLNVLVYQKPVILSIRCLLPELSLRYYCSVSCIIVTIAR